MDQSEYDSLTKEIKKALQKNDQTMAVAKIEEFLEKDRNTLLNMAITGESGSGKSSFVNAIRGIKNNDKGAAPTGCVETTTEVTSYPHPSYPNVTLSDLPGVGTMKFPADKYLEHVEFKKFDFFIIISATRFTENDVKLAQEIRRMGKKFYFVRSKIDSDLYSEEKSQGSEFDREKTLTLIRENCIQGLTKEGIEAPQVFLVSNFELHLYEFHLLHETLERELPAHKRNTLLFAMPNVNQEIIEKKKKAFQTKIKYIAALSAAVAGVPVPGLSTAVDISLLVVTVTQYIVGFGLDIPSLQRLANATGVPFNDLIAVIMSPLAAKKVTTDLILKLLCSSISTIGLIVAEEWTRFIPILGIPVAMSLSYITTYKGLTMFLNMLADDAQNVFKRALGLNTSV